ncbi:MAG: hypothetical protein ACOYMG_26820 [Candidatus Methylumidiphilus sp.]
MKTVSEIALTSCLIVGCGESPSSESAKASGTAAKPAIGGVKQAKVPPIVSGMAKAELSFKGIPLGKPRQMDAVIELCKTHYDKVAYKQLERAFKNIQKFRPCEWESFASRPNALFPNLMKLTSLPFGSVKKSELVFVWADSDGAINDISLDGTSDELIDTIPALTEKYGAPLVEKGEVQNGLGGRFEKITAIWNDANGSRLEVVTRGGGDSINVGTVNFSSARGLEKLAKDRGRAVEEIGKKL